MNVNEYQLQAHSFADYCVPMMIEGRDNAGNKKQFVYPIDYTYPALLLSEEAGEVAGKYAKAVRDNNGVVTAERKEAIVKELGDVMWALAELATLLNVSLEEVMQKNVDKLASRKERGVIHGSGDDR